MASRRCKSRGINLFEGQIFPFASEFEQDRRRIAPTILTVNAMIFVASVNLCTDMDWENLRFFLAVAREGSFSAAARTLKVDHATVGRRISALEADLGVRLIERLPRSCPLTASGARVRDSVLEMESHAYSVERISLAERTSAYKEVVISAPPVLSFNLLTPLLRDFKRLHPQIRLSLSSQEKPVSLSRLDADLALRLFRPTEPDYVVKKLGELRFSLYATTDYPYRDAPESWQFITYDKTEKDFAHRRYLNSLTQGRQIACSVTDLTTQYAAACSGVGVASLPCFLGDRDSRLQRLAENGEPYKLDIWLVLHRDLRNIAEIRQTITFITKAIRGAIGEQV